MICVMKMNQHKILLIEPPFYRLFKKTYALDRYPLSLGYLAGTLKNETDWDVMVYNADFRPGSEEAKVGYLVGEGFDNYLNNLRNVSGPVWEDIRSTISEYRPTVIGITAKSQNFASARLVAKLAKEIDNRIVVVVGGPHPSMVNSQILDCPDIDISVRGEGERTLVELLRALEADKKIDDIKGIIYRKDGKVIENPPREFITDLDSLCFPHENAPQVLKDYDKYPLDAFGHLFAARGCPYNCFFCGSRKIWSRRVRYRSPASVVKEMRALREKGLRLVYFEDDTFGVNKTHINDLCQAMIRESIGLKWGCELHVNLVDEPTISLMKKAGCCSIQLGIESGNNKILREIRKNITIEKAIAACKLIKKQGIRLHAFFMVGFPQETEEAFNDTVRAMKKVMRDASLLVYSVFTPYPGTESFEYCRQHGLIGEDFDVSLYNHQSPANCFCTNIEPERFRQLVSEIERMVDRKNSYNRIREIFSLNTLKKIGQLGIRKSIRKGMQILIRK